MHILVCGLPYSESVDGLSFHSGHHSLIVTIPNKTHPIISVAAPSADGRKGAQIDMLIDRADNMVNICEIKFLHNDYTVTKDDADDLHHKAERFVTETGCRKSVNFAMVTVSGIAHAGYWSEIPGSITSEDLFKA